MCSQQKMFFHHTGLQSVLVTNLKFHFIGTGTVQMVVFYPYSVFRIEATILHSKSIFVIFIIIRTDLSLNPVYSTLAREFRLYMDSKYQSPYTA